MSLIVNIIGFIVLIAACGTGVTSCICRADCAPHRRRLLDDIALALGQSFQFACQHSFQLGVPLLNVSVLAELLCTWDIPDYVSDRIRNPLNFLVMVFA